MEKLQAALQKARESRIQQGAGQKAAAPIGSGPQSVEDLWHALTEFEPGTKQLRQNRLVTKDAGPEAMAFDVLRTKVLLQMRQNGWRRIAITSPMPNSGKTTTACNLAMGLGRQADLRSILFDLDLRDPSAHKFFDTKPEHSLGDVLSGRVSFAEQAVRFGSNVAISMSPKLERDPAKLLFAAETAEVLDQIEATYEPDIMIFDLPSVLVNDDTRAFLKNADCALIVAWANATRYTQLDVCEREVAELTNVLGIVLNAYRYHRGRHKSLD